MQQQDYSVTLVTIELLKLLIDIIRDERISREVIKEICEKVNRIIEQI